MARLKYLTLAVAMAVGIAVANANGQTTTAPRPRVQTMAGAVTAVSTSSLTIVYGGKEIVFGADKSTRVIGKGMVSDLVLRPPPRLPDLVKTGDQVTVTYRLSGSVMKAVEVRVVRKSDK